MWLRSDRKRSFEADGLLLAYKAADAAPQSSGEERCSFTDDMDISLVAENKPDSRHALDDAGTLHLSTRRAR
jgi:hypothetical protein